MYLSKQFVFIISILITIVASSATHHPQDFLNSIAGQKNEGKLIYQHYCANCHAVKPLIPLGAPRVGVDVDWHKRLKNSVAVVIRHTHEGYNAMPARGGCFECSDQQLILAIIAMLPNDLAKSFKSEIKP